jgi:glutathione S-transferase
MSLALHGYRYSVYNRIARLALAEKGVAYDRVEVNPFAPDVLPSYLALHPFGRVPALVHDGFALYETGAIIRYIDRAFPGPALQPADPQALARMDQVAGIVDSYAYWPMVRQVFSHRVFRPRTGQPGDEAEIARGLQASTKVLSALEPLVHNDVTVNVTLADFHLGAMIAYFVQAPEGRQALQHYPRLTAWWARVSARPSFAATEPGLPGAPEAQSR